MTLGDTSSSATRIFGVNISHKIVTQGNPFAILKHLYVNALFSFWLYQLIAKFKYFC